MDALALAQLLQLLLPLGAKVYTEIRSANTNLPDVATLLSQSDQNWDSVIAAAQAEIAKLPAK